MKRLILVAITCIVVTQKHYHSAYLTECKNSENDGFVILDSAVVNGRAVSYTPSGLDVDYVRGRILGITEAVDPPAAKPQENEGKDP